MKDEHNSHIKISNAGIELHAHADAFLNDNSKNKKFMDIVVAMELNELDVVALESLDKSVYPMVCKGVKRYFADVLEDEAGIRFDGNRFMLNAREYTTKEGFHLLTIGHSIDDATPGMEIRYLIDKGLEKNALVIIAHPFVDNGKTKTAGHISKESEQELEKLCGEYQGQIALEWNGYCNNFARWGLKNVLNLFGEDIKYFDVNKKADDYLVSKHNIRILSGTDLHARNINILRAIGASRIMVDVEGKHASEIVSSMKKNILDVRHYNTRKTVGLGHLIEAYGVPLLSEIMYKKSETQ
jgi:hypothetical protein